MPPNPSVAYTQQQQPHYPYGSGLAGTHMPPPSGQLYPQSGTYPSQVNVTVQIAPAQGQQSYFPLPQPPQNLESQFQSTGQGQPTGYAAQSTQSQFLHPQIPHQQLYQQHPQPTSFHYQTSTPTAGVARYPNPSRSSQLQTGYGVQPGPATVSTATASGSGTYRMVIKAMKTKQNLFKHANAVLAVPYMTSRMETWNQLVHTVVKIVCITRNTINNYEQWADFSLKHVNGLSS